MHINRVTADEWTTNITDDVSRTHIPDLDCLIPTSCNQKVLLVLDEFSAKNTERVAWLTISTSFEHKLFLAGLLIVYSDFTFDTSSQKFVTI